MTDKQVVIWGAGKIGRGFVADFFYEADYQIVFIDSAQALVNELREAGRYTLVKANSTGYRKDSMIDGFSVLHTSQTQAIDEAIATTDLLCIAVYPNCLPAIASQLVPCILRRMRSHPDRPLNIVMCTNLVGAAAKFRQLLENELPPQQDPEAFDQYTGVVDTIIIRLVATPPKQIQEQDPLLVWTNGVADFPIDRRNFRGPVPEVAGIRPLTNMAAEQMRKLYTYNMFHAVLSYFGYWRGYKLIVECLQDAELRAMGEKALAESKLALQKEYGFGEEEMQEWLKNVIIQTNDPVLGDTVQRYANDPERKLRRDDRLVGPTLLARKHGLQPTQIIDTIAAALLYDDPADPGAMKVRNTVRAVGVIPAIHQLCNLRGEEADLVEAIAQSYERLSKSLTPSARTRNSKRGV
ncbi:MAG: hypothetical protein GYA59_02420 [Chloroflexi bacterium]|nr:hypothetical protein [Chloroflexota bacterium]